MSPTAADFRELPRPQSRLTFHARSWHAQGEPELREDQTIHVHRRVGGAPLLLLLHGFPTSSFDWRFVLIQDRERAAVTFDYPGLGCSDKPATGDYSVPGVADLAESLVEEHGQGRPVLVVAHDLGLSVAAELIARDLTGVLDMDLAGAIFLNGTIVPTNETRDFGRKLVSGSLGARFGGQRRFRRHLGRAFGPAHPLDEEEAADQWSLLSHNDGTAVADRLLAYLAESAGRSERWKAAVSEWSRPIGAVWGVRDPICGPEELEALRTLRPAIDVTELPEVGHYPQIEHPESVYNAIKQFVAASARGPGAGDRA